MELYYPPMGQKPDNKTVNVTFPPQHQDRQPGLEQPMNPRPIYDDPARVGTGKLAGKVALITGGDSGIGRAAAVAFAREGAAVAVSYLDEHDDANDTKKVVERLGGRCLLLPGDIADEATCQRLVADTVAAFGALDVLVNNAAVQYPQNSLLDITAQQLEQTFRVNVFGMFHLTRAALPHLKCGASIVSTTSVTAYEGSERLIDYSSTKGAIVSFTRALARSLAGQGVRVNAIAPGPVWTPLQPASWPATDIETFGGDTPMGRAAQPAELAAAYVYLACNDSSFVTGQVLHVNGGACMHS